MNFFDAQDKARRSTRRLIIVYLLATALIVAGVSFVVAFALTTTTTTSAGRTIGDPTPIVVAAAVITTLVILGATLIKTMTLSTGGAKVATSMGGVPVDPDTRDPLRRRLRNVVEEMAIASGTPMPDLFVLEAESGINAFAAGYTPGDAAIAVTRGALEVLDRDELQGVIAHEFSHVLNGDMRLNIRMMGVLYGIMVIGLLGRTVLRGSHYGALSSRRNKNGGAILFIGIGLAVAGWVGVFAARLIKAAVSRQREHLADASAVQFTRQTSGIAGALKKIGGYEPATLIRSTDPEEVSHMLFGPGLKFSSMFATHPPLDERIRALEPNFSADDYVPVTVAVRQQVADEAASQIAGFAAASPERRPVMEAIGNPTAENIAVAQQLRIEMPQRLYDAAHSTDGAFQLTIALLIDVEEASFDRQRQVLSEQLGDRHSAEIFELARLIGQQERAIRLPLLEIAFPALKRRPKGQLDYLLNLLHTLMTVDGHISIFEFCYYRVIVANVKHATDPTARPGRQKLTRRDVRDATLSLLRIVAIAGHRTAADAEKAFAAGRATLPSWAADAAFDASAGYSADALDSALTLLSSLNLRSRERLVRALTAVVTDDGVVEGPEAELMRATCAVFDCPLPIANGLGQAD